MSNSKTSIIRVRLRNQNHPTGQRRRAGFLFGSQPSLVEVTDDELKAIKADPYLQILPGGANAPSEDEGDEDGDGTTEIKLDRATKAQLVQILTEELKQVPGTDFSPEASNAILKQLVTDLRAQAAEDSEDEGDEDGDSDDDNGDDEGGDDK